MVQIQYFMNSAAHPGIEIPLPLLHKPVVMVRSGGRNFASTIYGVVAVGSTFVFNLQLHGLSGADYKSALNLLSAERPHCLRVFSNPAYALQFLI